MMKKAYNSVQISSDSRINPLKPSDATFALTINNAAFCIYHFFMILTGNRDISSNSIHYLIFVMAKCCVYFEVRNEAVIRLLLDKLRI
jgi:hypothetical protein